MYKIIYIAKIVDSFIVILVTSMNLFMNLRKMALIWKVNMRKTIEPLPIVKVLHYIIVVHICCVYNIANPNIFRVATHLS